MLLQVKDLRTYFHTEDGIVKAVDGVSFDLREGETLGVVGESGCGKSVTALSLLRLFYSSTAKIEGGEIRYKDKNLLGFSEEQMRTVRGNEIAMIFQEPMTSLNPVFTVGDQIAEALRIHRPELSDEAVRRRAVELLERVGIAGPERRYNEYPHQLSGGMRQRVMIAMALCCDPKILVADEPTTALDVTIQAQILELMKRLQRDLGMAVILITHDLGVVAEMVDRVMVMYAGRVIESGPVASIFAEASHPYTQGLLSSIPKRSGVYRTLGDAKVRELNTIPGVVPSLMGLPQGCAFQTRCPKVQPHCREFFPEAEEVAPNHWARCFEARKK